MDPSVCLPDESNLHAQYPIALQDYEQYTSECANSSIYVTKSPVLVPRVVPQPQCSYRADPNACTLMGGPNGLSAQQQQQQQQLEAELMGVGRVQQEQQHTMMPTIRYIQSAQYDELEYGLTSASCAVDSHYVDDPAITYGGYVSEATYGMQSDRVNTNAFGTRPLLFDDNLNGSGGNLLGGGGDKGRGGGGFENHHDFQSKMSQLTLGHPMDMAAQMSRDVKDEMLDGGGGGSASDICTPTRWRDPNLSEVISFLNNPNNAIKANAAAYLQHLCYMDDPNKQRTRTLGGIPPLIGLLSFDIPEIHKNACGALRNLSYGRQHDENKRAIKNAGGITALVNLLNRTPESEVKELVTGILWNMSSCEDIKRAIIDESLGAIVNNIIKPHSGWDAVCPGDTCFSLAFRNASGVLRNVSSAGEYARSSLRNAEHLIECLLYVVKKSIEKNNIGNKTVENCVCILRNLSYRCQEVEDPNYDKQQVAAVPPRALSTPTQSEHLGCFGTSKKRKEYAAQSEQQLQQQQQHEISFASGPSSKTLLSSSGSLKGYEQLWQPEVVQYYLALLQSCSNPETLEAAAGAIQNLSACFWQPSIDIRATVRKEKGLPILVELLRMEVDRVVCAVATALRNLAIDQRNKELIGKYAMRDLVQKLPSGNMQHDQTTSDDTISAVLATINEVIKRNTEFSRSLLDAGGVERLMNITRNRQNYTACVLKFASQVLLTMWQHYDLRDVYKKNGWKEQDFVTKSSMAAYNAAPNSPNNANNTLNRPMASQGRTKYEDRTIQRISNSGARNNERGGVGGGISIYNDPQMACQLVQDGVNDGGGGGSVDKRAAQNSGLYIPITDSTRNHSN